MATANGDIVPSYDDESGSLLVGNDAVAGGARNGVLDTQIVVSKTMEDGAHIEEDIEGDVAEGSIEEHEQPLPPVIQSLLERDDVASLLQLLYNSVGESRVMHASDDSPSEGDDGDIAFDQLLYASVQNGSYRCGSCFYSCFLTQH